jgi:hypothetical protein
MRRPLLALLALAACAAPDYTPVRDWSESASLAAEYRPAALGAPAEATSIGAMQDALSVFLTSLGIIAGDGVIPYRENPFKPLLPALTPADAAVLAPLQKLGEQLAHSGRNMDLAPQLRDLIKATDPNVQPLIAGLAAAVARQAAQPGLADTLRDAAVQQAGAAQYRVVLAEIAAGLTLMKDRVAKIETPEAAYYIHASQQKLQRAAEALPRPAMLPAAR